jgi:hypothetical protein
MQEDNMSLKGFAQVIQAYATRHTNEQVAALKTGLETKPSCTAAGITQMCDALVRDIPVLLSRYEEALLNKGIDPNDSSDVKHEDAKDEKIVSLSEGA